MSTSGRTRTDIPGVRSPDPNLLDDARYPMRRMSAPSAAGPESARLTKGGQGRDPEEVLDSAIAIGLAVLGVLAVLIGAWA